MIFVMAVLFASRASAAEAPAPVVESEALQRWKALRAQEVWVEKLKKQLQGELNQLSEMRATLARNFKLDPKKVENGGYEVDENSGKFVEKK